jgi:hypothetical protein
MAVGVHRLEAGLEYNAKIDLEGRRLTAPSRPTPPCLYIFKAPNGVSTAKVPGTHFSADIRSGNVPGSHSRKSAVVPGTHFSADIRSGSVPGSHSRNSAVVPGTHFSADIHSGSVPGSHSWRSAVVLGGHPLWERSRITFPEINRLAQLLRSHASRPCL